MASGGRSWLVRARSPKLIAARSVLPCDIETPTRSCVGKFTRQSYRALSHIFASFVNLFSHSGWRTNRAYDAMLRISDLLDQRCIMKHGVRDNNVMRNRHAGGGHSIVVLLLGGEHLGFPYTVVGVVSGLACPGMPVGIWLEQQREEQGVERVSVSPDIEEKRQILPLS